jgi:hypothetical protein
MPVTLDMQHAITQNVLFMAGEVPPDLKTPPKRQAKLMLLSITAGAGCKQTLTAK